MAYGIALKCLNETGAPVRQLWDEAAAFEAAPSMQALNYPPHLTLALYQTCPAGLLAEVVDRVFLARSAVTLRFSAISFFRSNSLILWAKPDVTDELLEVHAGVHKEMDPSNCHEHYRPASWVPHCTIAATIPAAVADAAIRWASQKRIDFSLTFDACDCVQFPPVNILHEKRLALV